MKRAVLWGASLALLVAALTIVVIAVLMNPPSRNEQIPRVLVVLLVPGTEQQVVAGGALVMHDSGFEPLDVLQKTVVPETSAQSARDAYQYGGGSAVARALAEQTGGEVLPWLALADENWRQLINDADGTQTTIPRGLSVYSDGQLSILESGTRTLDGTETVALVSALGYVGSDPVRQRIQADVAETIARAISERDGGLGSLIEDGIALSPVPSDRLPSTSIR